MLCFNIVVSIVCFNTLFQSFVSILCFNPLFQDVLNACSIQHFVSITFLHSTFSPILSYPFNISINLNAGASVDLVAHFAGDTLTFNTIYTFSLGSSLGDMWNACALLLGNRKDKEKLLWS